MPARVIVDRGGSSHNSSNLHSSATGVYESYDNSTNLTSNFRAGGAMVGRNEVLERDYKGQKGRKF